MKLEIIKGDITYEKVDAIVNAANSSLMGGSGVDGAIHNVGGPDILQECKEIIAKDGQPETGQAVFTSGGNLAARFVIHTVGPIWKGGQQNEESLLASCYKNSLGLAEELMLKSISFPNISTGVYCFPKKEAAEIAIGEIQKFSYKSLRRVRCICFDEENYAIYQALLNKWTRLSQM